MYAHKGGDRLGRQHHAALGQADADAAVCIQQREDLWLIRQGQIAVARAETGRKGQGLLLLQKAAALLEDKPETMERDVQEGLKKGLSFAAAQGKAMENALGADAGKLQLPNAALALGYLRALRQLNSCMQPVAVLRDTDYHAGEMEKYPSATAVRSALYRGDWQAVERAVPQKALPVLKRAVQQGRIFRPEGMDTLLRYALLQLGEEGIRKLPGVDEGLECRILSAAREHATWADMLEHVKTRRYTRGRIVRAFCWAVLGTMKEELPRQICGVQVLGFCESARPLLKKMQEGSLPLYMKKAREGSLLTENKYADIWQLMAGRDMGEHYRQGPVIIREE